jgi:hypothetical protein
MPIFAAISLCSTLQPHLAQPRTYWRVLSSHQHACNLVDDAGNVMALVTAQVGNGPFHVVAPPSALLHCVVGGRLCLEGAELYLPTHRLDLRLARIWRARLPSVEPTALRWARCVIQSTPSLSSLSSLQAFVVRARAALQQLASSAQTGNGQQALSGARQLAGLGPGLTPAGDDLLLGFMAGCWLSRPVGECVELCPALAECAAPHTTRLSAAWLRHAGQAEFGEAWHDLAYALQQGQPASIKQAMARILATGATSGQAALIGFATAMEER